MMQAASSHVLKEPALGRKLALQLSPEKAAYSPIQDNGLGTKSAISITPKGVIYH